MKSITAFFLLFLFLLSGCTPDSAAPNTESKERTETKLQIGVVHADLTHGWAS